jgi:hypothetical protein
MLTASKKAKMLNALKAYKKKFLDLNLSELDESGTRLMINHFLSDVLGYLPIEEIKTEYMIKGTYADYVVQTKGIRHFLVEVKALSFDLSDKHLRQTINYGANEGIEWALLTNGKNFEFYKILFNKPIESRKIFAVDLSDASTIKSSVDQLQYLHKEAILKKGLKLLWNKCEALFPENVAGIIYSKEIISTIKRLIKAKYGEKCDDDEVLKTLQRIVCEKFDPATIKPYRSVRSERRPKKLKENEAIQISSSEIIEELEKVPPSALN